MIVIMIEKETFERLFDEAEKDLDIAKYEHTGDSLRDGIADTHRKWIYAFRTLQQKLRDTR